MFGPGKKENKFIESEYRVKEGKQGGGGGNNSNQKKKNNNNEDQDEHQEQKKKVEEKSKIKAVELNVSLCCDRCAKQVKEALEDVEGQFHS
jgi:flagellar biosynthesis/type III secretory pathway M-ring protein FliF/YscJ